MQSENEIIHDIRHSVYLIKVKRLAMFTFFIIQSKEMLLSLINMIKISSCFY
ncbi:hypothetical protein VCHA37P192_30294 [Vibrio chagasii]|nr:hypothetical protein VCHA37P192_30294 [Vibrio chagasii]